RLMRSLHDPRIAHRDHEPQSGGFIAPASWTCALPISFRNFLATRFGALRCATARAESLPRGDNIIESLQPTPQRHGTRMAVALACQEASQLRDPPHGLSDRWRF